MRKINDVLKRTTATVLSVALLLAMCFPVPYMRAHDRLRIERAYANPAAGAAAAAAIVFGTLCAAYGYYCTGTSGQAFYLNEQQLYDDWQDYCDTQANLDKDALDAMLASSYSAGSVDMTTAETLAITGAIPAFMAWLQAGNGETNIAEGTNSQTVTLGQYPEHVGVYKGLPSGIVTPTESGYHGFMVVKSGNSWRYYEVANGSSPRYYDTMNGGNEYTHWSFSTDTRWFSISFNPQTGATSGSWSNGVDGGVVAKSGNGWQYYIIEEGTGVFSGVEPAADLIWDTSAENAHIGSTLNVWEPTDAQLSEGFTYENVLSNISGGIDDVNVNLGTISTGIAALDTVLNGILGVVSGIATNVLNIWNTLSSLANNPFAWLASWWQSLTGWWTELLQWIRATPLGTFCADVTSWLGATSIGTLIGGVVSAIPGVGTIEQTLSGVLDGVLDIPDEISGVLDGTLSIPDAIADVLTDVFGLDFAGTLEGVLEGVFFPNITLPTLSVNPTYADAVTFEGVLQDKAPFAYMFAFKNAVDGAAETYSNNASFRIRHYFDLAGEDVLFDINAEPYLNRDVGGVTIAQLLRASVTLTLCMGLLYAAYKTGIAAVGSREG